MHWVKQRLTGTRPHSFVVILHLNDITKKGLKLLGLLVLLMEMSLSSLSKEPAKSWVVKKNDFIAMFHYGLYKESEE